ncbi:MAG: cell wall metabolism sensor histidine kinase WalK [Clostridia bacterium]|nr:cell wall metabolism sensor histidine kinase WalK [Clostridia bacterium]
MFRSVLMRRTIALVIGALLFTTVLSTIAFSMASKTASLNAQKDEARIQTDVFADFISENADLIDNENFTDYFFSDTRIMGRSFFFFNSLGTPIYTPHIDNIDTGNTDVEAFNRAVSYIENNMLASISEEDISGKTEDYGRFFDSIFIYQSNVVVGDDNYYLVSVSAVTDDGETIDKFVNILLLSTLCAGFFMLIPIYLVIRRIIMPIQKINYTAQAYGRGDFSVRADEGIKGEVGEIATSFNSMADKISDSIDALTVERNRLQDIFDVISEGIVVVDEKLTPIVVNNTMSSIFDKVSKKNMFTEKLQLIPFNEIWEDYAKCIESGENVERQLEGTTYAYQVNIVPKFGVNNEIVGATGFFRDIYEELKLERTQREYVANISHELRTPLQTLRGLIEPLIDGMVKTEEDKQRYYGIILHETMRLSRLINDMLELSKLQSGTLAFKTFPFDLNELLSEIETKYNSVMVNAGITFQVKFVTGHLPTVVGNPDRVEQILVILLDNAKKYTPEGGSITIETEYSEIDEKVYVSVKDTGQGIHEYDIDHIFDRFFKADRARGKKGTGLGLAIAKELLTYMGETIKVDSEYGKGTTFTFTLKKVVGGTGWF